MPVHNKLRYLDRAVRSVINQRFRDFELLLIDDASTDGSSAQIQKVKDPRVKILRRAVPGPGGYAARNLGVTKASADWIAFLDADDKWYPDHLQNLFELASEPNALVVATGWWDIVAPRDEGRQNAFSRHHAGQKTIYLDFIRFLEEYSQKRKPVWTGVMAARTSLLKAVGGFPEHCRRGGDSATWLRLVATAGGIYLTTECSAVYYRDASTVTKLVSPEVQRNCIYAATRTLLPRIRSVRARRLLMRVSNAHILAGLKKRAIIGRLSAEDFGEYYFRANPGKYVLFRLHSILPRRVQPRAWNLYQRTMRLWRNY